MKSDKIVNIEATRPIVRDRKRILMDSFLSGKTENTMKAYSRNLDDFKKFLNVKNTDEAVWRLIGGDHGDANLLALEYRAFLMDQKLSANTINQRLAALRSLVKLARTLGLVPWSLEVKNLKMEAYRDTRGPGLENFRSMLSIIKDSNKPKDIRDKTILHLLFDMALRRSSVSNLDVEDIDIKERKMWIFMKGRSQKVLRTIPKQTAEVIGEWLKVRRMETGPLFTNFDRAGKDGRLTGTSIYRIVRDLGSTIGVKTRPHGIRHLAITEAIKETAKRGIGLDKVVGFSGHKNVQTLMVYDDQVQDMQGEIATMVAGLV